MTPEQRGRWLVIGVGGVLALGLAGCCGGSVLVWALWGGDELYDPAPDVPRIDIAALSEADEGRRMIAVGIVTYSGIPLGEAAQGAAGRKDLRMEVNIEIEGQCHCVCIFVPSKRLRFPKEGETVAVVGTVQAVGGFRSPFNKLKPGEKITRFYMSQCQFTKVK